MANGYTAAAEEAWRDSPTRHPAEAIRPEYLMR